MGSGQLYRQLVVPNAADRGYGVGHKSPQLMTYWGGGVRDALAFIRYTIHVLWWQQMVPEGIIHYTVYTAH